MRDAEEGAKFEQLRVLAEQMLLLKEQTGMPQVEEYHIKRLIHELQVYQIELEMQNEELVISQAQVEKSRNEYAVLYDLAPIGYFTLNEQAVIIKVNHMGCSLTGHRQRSLVQKPFRSLLTYDSGKTFYTFIQKVFETTEKQSCELSLQRKTGDVLDVHLEGWQIENQNTPPHCLLAVLDITERKRLEQEAFQLKLEQQQEIMKAILNTQEQERIRIGESLHNGLGQVLYAAKLNLQVALSLLEPLSLSQELRKNLQMVDSFLTEGIQLTRNISHDLVPTVIKDFGLEYALNEICSKVSSAHLSIVLDYSGFSQRLEQSLEISIFRIIQELINNILKHANASMAVVEVMWTGAGISIEVRDNGVGFSIANITRQSKGIGLSSVRNRVMLLHGTMDVHSHPGQGTQISIQLPLTSGI